MEVKPSAFHQVPARFFVGENLGSILFSNFAGQYIMLQSQVGIDFEQPPTCRTPPNIGRSSRASEGTNCEGLTGHTRKIFERMRKFDSPPLYSDSLTRVHRRPIVSEGNTLFCKLHRSFCDSSEVRGCLTCSERSLWLSQMSWRS